MRFKDQGVLVTGAASGIGEKVAVDVIGHLDRAVTHQRLNGLGVFAPLNPQRGAGVP